MIKAIKKIIKWLLIGLLIFGIVSAIVAFTYTFRVSYRMAKQAAAGGVGDVSFNSTIDMEQDAFSLRCAELVVCSDAFLV